MLCDMISQITAKSTIEILSIITITLKNFKWIYSLFSLLTANVWNNCRKWIYTRAYNRLYTNLAIA